MPFTHRFAMIIATALLCVAALLPRPAGATIVEYQTVLGNFQVNLYDNATPLTVANYLGYVQNGSYTNSIFHRSVSNFVIQGGGFTAIINTDVTSIPANAPVMNEPVYSNVRGTIAMAKGSDPNSATNQWFFNLADNSANLDIQNSGFTVFGEVIGNGMDVVDALAALPTYNFGGAGDVLAELPLQNYSATDFANGVPFDNTHLAIVTGIVVTDTTADSAAGLNPTPSTANSGGGPVIGGGGGGGGGSFGLFALLGLFALGVRQAIRS